MDYNLLIVDDEISVTKSLFRQFRRKYNVFTANSVREAIKIMEKENIQVILSDQRMPELTGLDFFSMIKEHYPDALKLIITGYSDIEAVIGAINEGQVFRYISKPWNPDELNSIIKEAFEKYELITKNRRLANSLQEANAKLEQKVRVRTKQLEEKNIELSRLNEEKNKYIGIVAHDLRNPIGAAQSFSELLLGHYDAYPKQDKIKFIEIINDRCEYALRLIADFLDASKIEAGIFDMKIEKNDYLGFVEKNSMQNNLLAINKSQKILITTLLNSLSFSFDKDKMEQVFNNLLTNAIKYSPPGKNIVVDIAVEKGYVVTKIIDHGQGIPDDELATIFDAYKTTSNKPTANEKSVGLGFGHCKKNY